MKYIFIDTNIFIYSALSSQKEHEIESLEKLKNVLENDNAKLLLPEVVKIEFDRSSERLYAEIKGDLDSLKNIKLPPHLEEEKNRLFRAIDEISKDKDKKYQYMRQEVESLLKTKNVQLIPFDSNVLVQSYKRGMKREKPFKATSDSLRENFDFIEDTSWINDALIVESLVEACKSMDINKDTLLFCSNNSKDFAKYDKKSEKHYLHSDIKKDIPVETIYYLNLPDMLEKEFKESLSKETKENIKEAEKFHGGMLERLLKERLIKERNLENFMAAGLGSTGLLADIAKNQRKYTELGKSRMELYDLAKFAEVVEAASNWENEFKKRHLGLGYLNRMYEQSLLFSKDKKKSSETETPSENE